MRYAWAAAAWVPFGISLHGSCNLGGGVQHGLLSATPCMVHAALASTLLWMSGSFRLALCVMMYPCFWWWLFFCCDDVKGSPPLVQCSWSAVQCQSYACFYGLCLLLVGQVVAILLLLGLLSPAWLVSFVRWWHPFCLLLIGLLSLALCSISGCVVAPSVIW